MIKELDYLIESKNPENENSINMLDTEPAMNSFDMEGKYFSS